MAMPVANSTRCCEQPACRTLRRCAQRWADQPSCLFGPPVEDISEAVQRSRPVGQNVVVFLRSRGEAWRTMAPIGDRAERGRGLLPPARIRRLFATLQAALRRDAVLEQDPRNGHGVLPYRLSHLHARGHWLRTCARRQDTTPDGRHHRRVRCRLRQPSLDGQRIYKRKRG